MVNSVYCRPSIIIDGQLHLIQTRMILVEAYEPKSGFPLSPFLFFSPSTAFHFSPSHFSLPITLPQFDAHWKSSRAEGEREWGDKWKQENRNVETSVELEYKRQRRRALPVSALSLREKNRSIERKKRNAVRLREAWFFIDKKTWPWKLCFYKVMCGRQRQRHGQTKTEQANVCGSDNNGETERRRINSGLQAETEDTPYLPILIGLM